MFLVVSPLWSGSKLVTTFVLCRAAIDSRSLVEAAAIDGAWPVRRFFRLALPLIALVSFFLLVVNLVRLLDTFRLSMPQPAAAGAGDDDAGFKILPKVSAARPVRFRRPVGGVDVLRHYSGRWCNSVTLEKRCYQ